jgi:hypothetical protein
MLELWYNPTEYTQVNDLLNRWDNLDMNLQHHNEIKSALLLIQCHPQLNAVTQLLEQLTTNLEYHVRQQSEENVQVEPCYITCAVVEEEEEDYCQVDCEVECCSYDLEDDEISLCCDMFESEEDVIVTEIAKRSFEIPGRKKNPYHCSYCSRFSSFISSIPRIHTSFTCNYNQDLYNTSSTTNNNNTMDSLSEHTMIIFCNQQFFTTKNF